MDWKQPLYDLLKIDDERLRAEKEAREAQEIADETERAKRRGAHLTMICRWLGLMNEDAPTLESGVYALDDTYDLVLYTIPFQTEPVLCGKKVVYDLTLRCPHPDSSVGRYEVMMFKLEVWQGADQKHERLILAKALRQVEANTVEDEAKRDADIRIQEAWEAQKAEDQAESAEHKLADAIMNLLHERGYTGVFGDL